ncbi:restriction endonuclease subunit S [Pseudomonas sp. SWRI77]|uniref:restriction endonuclease subunit S n=1 Tax=Pseudomonas sp. SWRI77 TaxID=2745485 RepID=UPI0016474EBC|nr:restriction endonuclease subunit S [Pseudomonas sp. SWRI77]MBC3479037.1 restriction endonuclease subunit S [Pseudomonas sp. SWRI77]
MIELPKGWTTATLNDLLGADGIFSDGDWIESKDQDPNGANRLLQLADIGDGLFFDKSSRYVNDEKFSILNCTELKEGDVLIARMPAPLGRACLLPAMPQRCLTVVDIAVFRAGSSGVSNKWLMHFLNSSPIRREMELNSSGTTRKRISRGKLGEILLSVPPIAEQIRIAAKLEELMVQIDTLKSRIDGIPALLKRFRQSVLTAATSGRLTSEQCSSGYEKWNKGKLGDFVAIDIGHAFKSSEFSADGIRLLRGQNIEPGSLRWIETKFFPEEKLSSFEYLLISEGDIILAMDRPIVSAGLKLARAKREDLPCLLVQRVCRFKQSQKILNDYLMLLLSDYAFSNYLIPNQTGSDIPHISGKQILNYPVTLPPLHEQTEIVRRVEKLFAFADQFEVRVKAAQARIDLLTQSILTRAFRGELVPQDPNDEPASVLLERIKAQRAAAPKARRGRQPGPVKPKVGRTSSCEPLELEAKGSTGC